MNVLLYEYPTTNDCDEHYIMEGKVGGCSAQKEIISKDWIKQMDIQLNINEGYIVFPKKNETKLALED